MPLTLTFNIFSTSTPSLSVQSSLIPPQAAPVAPPHHLHVRECIYYATVDALTHLKKTRGGRRRLGENSSPSSSLPPPHLIPLYSHRAKKFKLSRPGYIGVTTAVDPSSVI